MEFFVKNKLFFALLLIPNLAFGQVTLLNKDEPAPYKGYLFSPEDELETRIKVSKVNLLESLTIKQGEQIDILKDRIDIKEQQLDNLAKQLQSAEKMSDLNKLIYFVLGGVIVGAIVGYVGK